MVHTSATALVLFLTELLNGIRGHGAGSAAMLGCTLLAAHGEGGALFSGAVSTGIAAHGLGDGDGLIVADGVDGLAEVVVGAGLGHVHLGVVGREGHIDLAGPTRRTSGTFLSPQGKVQVHRRCTVLGPVGKVGDEPVCGIVFGALEHMGNTCCGNHTVFQKHIAHLDGRQQVLITIGHRITSSLYFHSIAYRIPPGKATLFF